MVVLLLRKGFVMELKEIVQQMKDKDFAGYCTPGCGALLGLRLIVQNLEKFVLVGAQGCTGRFDAKLPYLDIGNAAAAAAALARAAGGTVVAYSGEGATAVHLGSLIDACGRSDNFLYVCYNNFAYPSERHVVRSVATYARYAATASIAYPEDFLAKLKKALSVEGAKFIELLAPCPGVGGFDTSNTIEVARMATECALWPVFEVESKKISITKRPLRLEPVTAYYAALKRQLKEDELQKIQDSANRSWKSLTEGKFV